MKDGWLKVRRIDSKPTKSKIALYVQFNERITESTHVGQCQVELTVPTAVLKAMDIKRYEVRVKSALEASQKLVVQPELGKTHLSFMNNLKKRLARSKKKEIYVYVHGYLNSFQDSMIATARMAFAFKHDGVPVAFSWPSAADKKLSEIGYREAQSRIDHAAERLVEFLRLIQKSKPDHIHLIAHSMGTQVVSRALYRIETPHLLKVKMVHPKLPLTTIVFSAADVEREGFLKSYAKSVMALSKTLVLYVSKEDVVLMISKVYNNGRTRLGDFSGDEQLIPGVSTIDVSEVARGDDIDTIHSYHQNVSPVVRDLDNLLRGIKVTDRSLDSKIKLGRVYYQLGKTPKAK
jgi:esterase/lipase superfamily enzyme